MGNTDLTKSQDKSQCALKPKKMRLFGYCLEGCFSVLCVLFFLLRQNFS